MLHSIGLTVILSGLFGPSGIAAGPAVGGSSPPKVMPAVALVQATQLTPAPMPAPAVPVRIVQQPVDSCNRCGTSVRSFIWGNDRYDPMIRDIRLVPTSRMLPGGDFGRRETLPILPAREFGYFVTPRH